MRSEKDKNKNKKQLQSTDTDTDDQSLVFDENFLLLNISFDSDSSIDSIDLNDNKILQPELDHIAVEKCRTLSKIENAVKFELTQNQDNNGWFNANIMKRFQELDKNERDVQNKYHFLDNIPLLSGVSAKVDVSIKSLGDVENSRDDTKILLVDDLERKELMPFTKTSTPIDVRAAFKIDMSPFKNQSTELLGFNEKRDNLSISAKRSLVGSRTAVTTFTDTRSDNEKAGSNDQHYTVIRSGRRAASRLIYESKCLVESDQTSEDDSSYEVSLKNKNSRPFIFFDLTAHEVVEDEDHIGPDASVEELEVISSKFIQSLEITENHELMKKKRKLYTPNYESEIPFKEEVERREVSNPAKETKLRISIPTYLLPNPKKPKTCSFLESLDGQLVPECYCDRQALPFRENFKKKRRELVHLLFDLYNKQVFGMKMKLGDNIFISWCDVLQKSSGRCRLRRRGVSRMAEVQLNKTTLSSANRLRDTLIRQLCYAASWVLKENGKDLSFWTEQANEQLPQLPKITIAHKSEYKYSLKCGICNLRSYADHMSRKIDKARCSNCHGPIIFSKNVMSHGEVTYLPLQPSMFAKFVTEKYRQIFEDVDDSHIRAMEELSERFAKLMYKKGFNIVDLLID